MICQKYLLGENMRNNILLLFGGNSVEHEISIITAVQIIEKYKGKYNLIPCYLKEGLFYISNKLKKIDTFKTEKFERKLKKIAFRANQNFIIQGIKKIHFDAVWIVAHGSNCEDGTLYSFFKTLNINVIAQPPYSALIGHDKILLKKLCGIPIVPYIVIDNHSFSYDIKNIIEDACSLGFPLIIKPSNLGSSIGIKQVNDIDELMIEIEQTLCLSERLIVEKKIESFNELNIAAFSYEDEIYFSSIEKVSVNKVLSYEDKYLNQSKSMKDLKKELPAKISDELERKIIEYTKEIYRNVNCKYIVRFDYIYDNVNDILYINEINNIPGSLALYLFEDKGMNFDDIIDKYINQGLIDIGKDKNLITSYENNILKENNFIFSKTNK